MALRPSPSRSILVLLRTRDSANASRLLRWFSLMQAPRCPTDVLGRTGKVTARTEKVASIPMGTDLPDLLKSIRLSRESVALRGLHPGVKASNERPNRNA